MNRSTKILFVLAYFSIWATAVPVDATPTVSEVGLGDVQWGRVGESALVGGISGFAGGAVGHWAANASVLVNGINSPIARTLAIAPLASGAGHLAGGTASGVFKGQGFSMAFNNSFHGLGKRMLIGTGIGVASTVGVSYANGINPINGKLIPVKTNTQSFKPFAKSHYRYNLKVLTGEDGAGMDAHHIFPQAKKFQSYFEKAGINIHDPKNLRWWQSGPHRSTANAYSNAWSEFFRATPNATSQQIQNFGNSLMKRYGF